MAGGKGWFTGGRRNHEGEVGKEHSAQNQEGETEKGCWHKTQHLPSSQISLGFPFLALHLGEVLVFAFTSHSEWVAAYNRRRTAQV